MSYKEMMFEVENLSTKARIANDIFAMVYTELLEEVPERWEYILLGILLLVGEIADNADKLTEEGFDELKKKKGRREGDERIYIRE